MARQPISELDGREFDVVVIGAGVNGASGAHHLAAEGYSVLIVDKSDFATGSSSRSSRLLHCGLRFIEPGEGLGYRKPTVWEPLLKPRTFLKNLGRARDAMHARTQIGTTMAKRLFGFRFHFPVWKGDFYRPWQVSAGMRLVESVGPSGGTPLEIGRMSAAEALRQPMLEWLRRPEDLLSVHSWKEFRYEWPERIVMDTILDVQRLGGIARNHTAVTSLKRDGDLWRVELEDGFGGGAGAVVAKAVLNTTGIWTDRVNRLASESVGRRIMGTKGIHIMFRLPPECDLTAEGMPNVFNMTSSPIQSHRLAGKMLSDAVKGRLAPSGKPQAIDFNAKPYPDAPDSPTLLNHWDGVRIADLRHAAEHEQPATLEDLLFRRVGAGWTETMAREGARVAADAVADILGWDEARIDKEVNDYLAIIAHRHGVGTGG